MVTLSLVHARTASDLLSFAVLFHRPGGEPDCLVMAYTPDTPLNSRGCLEYIPL